MESIVPCETGKVQDMVRRMAATSHFNALSAHILEIIKEMAHFSTGHLVAAGMSHDRDTASTIDPLDRSFQTDPAMIDITRFARR